MAEQFSLMAVYAHPDDEQGVSGSFIKYSRMGVNTTLVVATRGEAGEIAPDTGATVETLGDVREREMRCAAGLMEVKNLYFLDYCDSGMAGTPMNEDPMSFHQAPLMDVVEKVVRIIRQQRPQVLLTFDPWGGYGHPDHIKIHQATTTAYYLAGDPRAFPEQISKEGLAAWAPQKLYYGAFSRELVEKWIRVAFPNGEEWDVAQGFVRRAMPEAAITTRIDVQDLTRLKMDALKCHATQLGPNTFFARVPEEMRMERMTVESFVLAESREGRAENETDLFDGVKV